MNWWTRLKLYGPEGDAGGGAAPDAGKGAEGGEKPAGEKPTGGDGEKPENVDGLKSALQKERERAKTAEAELRATSKTLEELKAKAGTAEEQAKKLDQLGERLKGYELRDARAEAVSKAAKDAAGAGKEVDQEKMLGYLNDLGGDVTPEKVAKGLQYFSRDAGKPGAGGQGQKPTGLTAPSDKPTDGGQQKELSSAELVKLNRDNPEGYKAYMRAERAKNPLLAQLNN